MFAPDGEKINI